MNNPTIAVIGAGDFSAYLIGALRRGGYGGRILLSPYNRAKAQALAAKHGCEVAADATSLLAEANWILLAVRPGQLGGVLAKLSMRPGQLVISAVAGVAIAQLQTVLGHDTPVVRIMPSSYIDTVGGGIIPVYPASADVEAVLTAAGKVVAFDTEDQFELSMVGACLSGWMYRFVGSLEGWFVEHGLSQSQARLVVAGNIAGAAGYSIACQNANLTEISDGIATEGTYTKVGLDHLLDSGAACSWLQALDIVHARLKP